MSIFATLVAWIAGKLGALLVAIQSARYAARVTVLTSIAASYVALLAVFNLAFAPAWSALVGHQYGQLLGLLFPPASGTVLASLVTVWTALLAYRYVSSLAAASVR